ncbi:MAG: hypothetical protein V3W51_04770 [Candidatus Brocadiales bacterium]
MAVDSRQKRFSMLNFGDGTHIHATFEADGAVDLDDRQHLLDCYSGIAFGAPAAQSVFGVGFIPLIGKPIMP